VVLQPSQFSFVRHHAIPRVDSESAQWQHSVAVAKIAMAGSWQSPAEGALYFHAKRSSPGWHRHRVAEIENHIFYQ
jgi:spore germination cell wall hydrolase CwlJ-like protein